LATFNFAGLAAWGCTVAAIPLPDLDIVETCAIGTPRVDDEGGKVEIPFVVWPTLAPWDPATMEADAPPPIPEMQYESELDTPAAPSAVSVVQYSGGAYETRVRFAAVTGGTIAEAVYRTYAAGEPSAFASMTEYSGAGSTRYAYAAANTVGSRLDAKCRFFNDDDEGSYYSALTTVDPMAIDNSAPAAPTLDVVKESGSLTYNVSVVSTDMNVVSFKIQKSISSTWTDIATGDARPEVPITVSISETAGIQDRTVSLRAYGYSSNGTPSAEATASYVIPGTGT
jgi:hypothetical protein